MEVSLESFITIVSLLLSIVSFLENVNRTHRVLASGSLVLPKKIIWHFCSDSIWCITAAKSAVTTIVSALISVRGDGQVS